MCSGCMANTAMARWQLQLDILCESVCEHRTLFQPVNQLVESCLGCAPDLAFLIASISLITPRVSHLNHLAPESRHRRTDSTKLGFFFVLPRTPRLPANCAKHHTAATTKNGHQDNNNPRKKPCRRA